MINDESVTLAAGKGVVGLFVKVSLSTPDCVLFTGNFQPIGAFSRLVSDTGRSLLRRDDSGLSWSIKKEQMDHHFFSFIFDETVHHSQRCSFSDQNDNFLILTNTHVIVLSETLEQLMIWEVGNILLVSILNFI